MPTQPLSGSRAFLIAVLASLCGCTSTRSVQPTSLASLDGYQTHEPARPQRSVVALDGKEVPFDHGSELSLRLRDQSVVGRFESISVQDGTLRGRTTDGRSVAVPVGTITAAQVRNPDVLGTALLAGLGVVVVGLIAFAVLATDRTEATPGRALRIRGRMVLAPEAFGPQGWHVEGGLASSLAALPAEARDVLAAHWSQSARGEHASVPAFARLSLTLMAFGAPSRLVEAAHRAALEEIEHARLTFALASAYAGTTVAPSSLAALMTAPATTAASLEDLASESLIDGCYLEGVAAEAAAVALSQSRDPAVHAALTAIVRDERAHAELAWQVLAWCCATGGPSIRHFVLRQSQRLPVAGAPREVPAALHAELAAHGWLPPTAWRAVEQRTRSTVTARASALAAAPEHQGLHLV